MAKRTRLKRRLLALLFALDLGLLLALSNVDCFAEESADESAELTAGKYYSFAGYNWIVAELHEDYAVLQCAEAVTSGYWPGYTMEKWGNGSSYKKDIAGADISDYNGETLVLYETVEKAEYQSAEDGDGLYLVSNDKVGVTVEKVKQKVNIRIITFLYDIAKILSEGINIDTSGYYSAGLQVAAAENQGSWLGSYNILYEAYNLSDTNMSNRSHMIDTSGLNQISTQDTSLSIAPAFNLDLSKVKVDGTNKIITIKEPSFVVTIPDTLSVQQPMQASLDDLEVGEDGFEIKAALTDFGENDSLVITVESKNGYRLLNDDDNQGWISYSLSMNDELFNKDLKQFSVSSDGTETDEQTIRITAAVIEDNAHYAGTYQDILTFTFSLE